MTDYERYQLQWMIEHGYSLHNLIEKLDEHQFEYEWDGDMPAMPVVELFEDWEFNRGFAGEIWVCEAEWREHDA